jgi:hypothetical protein
MLLSLSKITLEDFTLPFLDHLIFDIRTRFSEWNLNVLNGFFAFPTKVVTYPQWKEKFMAYLNDHLEDLPEPRYLATESRMWEDHCINSLQGVPPMTLSTLLPTINQTSFPNIYTALQILATLPVTTCTCERDQSQPFAA